MDFQQFTLDDEANDRNAVLSGQYNKIPSYALWRDYDIEKETKEERIVWWKNYQNADNIVWKTLANQWLNYFNKDEEENSPDTISPDTKSPDTKSPDENAQLVGDNNQEFCSKRFNNELYCDI